MDSNRARPAVRAAVGGVLASVALASPAAAAPTAAEKETARGLMAEGRAARAHGDVQGAMRAFAAAEAIMHVPTTGIELAKTQAAAGLLVEARDTALRVTRFAEDPGEPAPFRQARRGAIALETELEGRIPTIRLSVKNLPQGVTPKVEVDDIATPAEVLDEPIRVDPGHHVLAIFAGTAEGRCDVDLAEMDSKDVTVELPPQAQERLAASPATHDEPVTPPVRTERPAEHARGSPALVVAGFATAGAGALAGLITGALSISKTSSVKSSAQCQNGGTLCSPFEDGELGSARAMATVSDVSFLLAGAGAVAGIAGLLVAPSPTRARVEPWVGLGALGLRGTF